MIFAAGGGGVGMLVKVGRPILGMYLKIGQNGTRVGRYLKKVTKKWDILYESSLMRKVWYHQI